VGLGLGVGVAYGSVISSSVVRTGIIGLALITSGCGFFLPAGGPNSVGVLTGTSARVPYVVVPLTPKVVQVLADYEPAGLAGMFSSGKPPPSILFNIGDVVTVTIFEAAAGGLFIPIEAGVRPGNYVTLPNQVVDNDGNISVPYAGLIRAAGRTNVQIQNDIVDKIKNRAIEPQVVVAMATQNSQLISVFGEVHTAVRYPAAGLGARDRITDAITRAGGISDQGYQTWVMLERGGKRGTVPFANLVYEPSNNIFVQPGDRIYVYQEDQKFTAFGASGQQGEFPFAAWRINLASAVAKAGGLVDQQADPASVFLYRREPRHVAELFGADVSGIEGDLVPVVFNVNMRDPSGYFLATKLQMRNADVIFVANAEAVEVSKFMAFVNNVMTTTSNGIVTYNLIRHPNLATTPTTSVTVTSP
jgi:polysaccharide biosynthesis/export protein